MREIAVNVFWDDEASVWCASSEDVPGLNTWAASREELHRKVAVMIPELLEDDGLSPMIPYHLRDMARFATHLA